MKTTEAGLPQHRPPTHPGEMLLEEFLKPAGISQSELAREIGVSFQRVNALCNQRREMTPDTALRLAKVFGTSPEFWMGLQASWDLWHAMRAPEAKDHERIRQLRPA